MKRSLNKGYSLPEIVIYIGILVFLSVTIVTMLISFSHSKGRLTSAQNLSSSALTSMDRMVREIRSASDVNLSTSVLGTNPGKLVLSGADSSGASRTVEFSIISNTLHIKENTVDMGPLTQNGVLVTNLVFQRSASTTDQAVKIEMTLETGTSTSYKTEKFYSTAVLRQSL
jgi:type II secretory pathway pseudopilin PulG